MTHPTPTHLGPGGPGRQHCTDERPHEPHPVRPRRLAWTPFQCAGRPPVAETDRVLDEAFGLEPQTT